MSETDTEYAHAIIRTATRWFYFVVTVVSDKMLYRAEVKKRMLLKSSGQFSRSEFDLEKERYYANL